MKKLTLLLLAIVYSVFSFAQSHATHDVEMARFQRFYNHKIDDSIGHMFSRTVWSNRTPQEMWPTGRCAELQKKYGEIRSFTYIGEMDDDPTLKLYKVVSTKKTFATGICLDEHNKLVTFRFHTHSDHIDKLMKETK